MTSLNFLSLRNFLVLSTCLIMTLSGCKKEDSAADIAFAGNFTMGNADILCKEKTGEAIFTIESSGKYKFGDLFIKITQRTGKNTWRGQVYDAGLVNFQEGNIKMEQDSLYIFPANAQPYSLRRIAVSGGGGNTGGGNSGSGGNGSGTGCSSVQCSGRTQSGNRCQRMTTNCSGRCYQH